MDLPAAGQPEEAWELEDDAFLVSQTLPDLVSPFVIRLTPVISSLTLLSFLPFGTGHPSDFPAPFSPGLEVLSFGLPKVDGRGV